MRYVLIAYLVALTPDAFACSCEWGEYYYPLEKLEDKPIEPEPYYQAKYGVKDLKSVQKEALNPRIEDLMGFMVINLPITEKFRGHIFRFILESKVTLEPQPNKGFIYRSTFKVATFKPSSEVGELTTRMESKGNEWYLYILALNEKSEIVASATYSGKDTCGKDVYVSSIERAKELDSKRTSGCFQTGGYK